MEKTLQSKKKKDFTQVENCILRNPDISRNAKLVYFVLESYDFDGTGCFPGQERIAAELGVGLTTVKEALRELRGWGLISWRQQGFNLPNIYTIEEIPQRIKDEYFSQELELKVVVGNPKVILKTKEEKKEKRKYRRVLKKALQNVGKRNPSKVES